MESAPPTFLWHDYETFGRSPQRDRPAQFAALRTDGELREIGEPSMWYCRPAPDYLPDPESVLLTGILPQRAAAEGLVEAEFAARIEALLATPGTIGVGYNSIRFDDEFTRFLFWRNLIDPYGREWQNGCCRWDLLDTVRCAWALRPAGIEWPLHPDGRPSFRLEDLSAANGLAHADAHDALADVRATLALARLVRERQPRLWAFCLGLRRKDAVAAEIGVGRPFVHLSGRYPAERGFLAIVWPLAPHPTNRNELIVWDLAHDPSELATLDAATVRLRLYTPQAELPAGVERLPIKTVHLNRSPVVIGNLRTLGSATARFGIDLARVQANALRARELGRTLDPLWREVYARPPRSEPPDVDEDLYGGFVGDADRRRLAQLRALPPEALAARRVAFDDDRLEELLFRYRARNFPASLDDAERGRWLQHCRARLVDGAARALTLAAYFERIDALALAADSAADGRGDARAQALLEALYDYAEAIAPEA